MRPLLAGIAVLLAAAALPAAAADTLGLPPDWQSLETYDEYAPYREARLGRFTDEATRTWEGQWETLPTSNGTTDVSWGDPEHWDQRSIEEHAIRHRCAGGHSFVWLDAYRHADGKRFAIKTTRAILRHRGGTFDITPGGHCGTSGQPYALYRIFPFPYELQVWGKVYSADGMPSTAFFWQERVTPNVLAENSCWEGDAQTTRRALRQDEAWWDAGQGWAVGKGSLGLDGLPTGTDIVYGGSHYIAQGVGFGWLLRRTMPGSWIGCLRNVAWVPRQGKGDPSFCGGASFSARNLKRTAPTRTSCRPGP